jgi:hypothetical protein
MQSVLFGTHPSTRVPQAVFTDGNGAIQVNMNVGSVFVRGMADNADAIATTATTNSLSTLARNTVFNGTTWDRQRGDLTGTYVVTAGSPAAGAALVPLVALGVNTLNAKASAGNLYEATCIAGTTAGFLVAYNAVAAPAPAAALTAALVLNVVPVPAGAVGIISNKIADRFGTGICLIFTTSLATYTAPATPAAFLQAKFV